PVRRKIYFQNATVVRRYSRCSNCSRLASFILPIRAQLFKFIAERTLICIGKRISVFYIKCPIKPFRHLPLFKKYRTPYLFYRIETSFLLVIWPHDTIRTMISVGVYDIVFVGTHQSLILKIPKESPCRQWISPHRCPVIFDTSTMPAIPHTMQEFRRHHNIMAMVIRPDTIIIFPVVRRFETTIYCPRIDQWAFLDIVSKK